MTVINVLLLILMYSVLGYYVLYPSNRQDTKIVYVSDFVNFENPEIEENKTEDVSNLKKNKKISILDLSNTGIVNLKKSFASSSVITRIKLSDNNIWKIENYAFDSLPNLKSIDLTGNLIKFDQLNFGNHTRIETLILDRAIRNEDRSNYSYHSNDECSKAQTYREQSLSFNNTIKLTTSLNLPGLKKLYLRQNNIDLIYLGDIKSLGDIMPEISHLHLDDNRLSSLDFIRSLPSSLSHLYLTNNEISNFESYSWINLKFLTIDGNKIKNLCRSYENCEGMTLINAVNLRTLSVSNVGLEEIELDSFIDLVNLRHLNMSHNKIIEIVNHTLNYMTNLKTLDLDHNKLVTVPDILGLKNLRNLSLAHNKIETIGKSDFLRLANLQKLNLSYNLVHGIDAESFSTSASLTELDLSGNRLEVLPSGWLSSNSNLRYLCLKNNLFKSFESLSLADNENVKYLYISGNPFKSINRQSLMFLPVNVIMDIRKIISELSDMSESSSCLSVLSFPLAYLCYAILSYYYFS